MSFFWDAEDEDGHRFTLKDINLDIAPGEFSCIIGPSGCGKSTLLSLLCGLLHPSEGEVLLGNEQVAEPRREIGIVFQDYSLFPWLNVEHNIAFGMRLNGLHRKERKTRVAEFLEQIGLAEFARKYPHQLSGGMRQRVAIARALANEPQCLLMDEPFGALDYQTRLAMQKFLLQIWGHFKQSIVFVTHDIEEGIFLSDRIHLMSTLPGRIVETIEVGLPRPREETDPRFLKLRKQITSHLEQYVTAGNHKALEK